MSQIQLISIVAASYWQKFHSRTRNGFKPYVQGIQNLQCLTLFLLRLRLVYYNHIQMVTLLQILNLSLILIQVQKGWNGYSAI